VRHVEHEMGLAPARRDYRAAVELGHVLARSGFFKTANDPAKAAVKVMVGMDLGISPTAAIMGVDIIDTGDGPSIALRGRLLAGILKASPKYRFEILDRDDQQCSLRFFEAGAPWPGQVTEDHQLHPDITFTMADAERASLTNKKNWKQYPRDMLYWRALAEGVRVHCPDITTGTPVYTTEELNLDEDTPALTTALGDRAQPLTDEKAEKLRKDAKAAYDQLRELNPGLLPPGQFNKLVRDAEHSHERLVGVVEQVVDLRDVEGEINEGLEGIKAISEDTAAETERKIARVMNRREALGIVREDLDRVEKAEAKLTAEGRGTPDG
jgi:hypothetical protein